MERQRSPAQGRKEVWACVDSVAKNRGRWIGSRAKDLLYSTGTDRHECRYGPSWPSKTLDYASCS